MSSVGEREARTRQRVIAFFKDAPDYAYLGHWQDREGNSNVEAALLTNWPKRQGHSDKIIAKVLHGAGQRPRRRSRRHAARRQDGAGLHHVGRLPGLHGAGPGPREIFGHFCSGKKTRFNRLNIAGVGKGMAYIEAEGLAGKRA